MREFLRRFLRSGNRLDQSGITLVEVLAAVTVLSLGLLALMPMAVTSIVSNEFARDTRGAMEQIENRIERFRIADSVVAGSELDTASGLYASWWAENEGTGLKKVIVDVSWTSDGGAVHHQRGTTYIYRK
jgi:type IV pilus assembly protein PilV